MFPFLRYKDAPAAIDCLAKAFGFEEQTVVQNENGTIAHAEVEFGSGVMMPASARDDELRIKSPRDLGAVSGGIYVYVEDVDAHCGRTRAADAEIIRGPENTDYSSREYTARDAEGHLWSFGSCGRTRRSSGGRRNCGGRPARDLSRAA